MVESFDFQEVEEQYGTTWFQLLLNKDMSLQNNLVFYIAQQDHGCHIYIERNT